MKENVIVFVSNVGWKQTRRIQKFVKIAEAHTKARASNVSALAFVWACGTVE
jgi:hypothetical protein